MGSPTIWHPVLAAQDLRAGRGVVAARLLGQELALWRSEDGQAQAWDNRCPHRGVRLSLGRVVGNRLACAYHGWEYAAGSGRCVAIPAMPQEPVPGRVCTRAFAVRESQSMIWVALDAQGDPGPADTTPVTVTGSKATPTGLPIRSLAARATLDVVDAALASHGFVQHSASRWDGTLAERQVRAFTQSVDSASVMIHLWLARSGGDFAPPALFAAARRLRCAIEGAAP